MSTQQAPDPSKPKKQTPTELKKELEELGRVAGERQTRIRDTEIKIQKVRDLIKTDGPPGLTMQQDHHRLSEAVNAIRKILDIKVVEYEG